MALLSFPTSPVNGELYPTTPVVGQNQYQWEAATQTWRLLGAAIGVTAGTYGDATNVPQITVDTQGRVTAVSNVAITANVQYVTAPTASSDPGSIGQVAMDSSYFYWYDGAAWQRVAADATPW